MGLRKSAAGTRSLEVIVGDIPGRVPVLEFTLKQGAVGTVLSLLLCDETGPALLRDREILATLKASFMPAAIVDAPVAADKNQFQKRGRIAFTLDEKSAAIAAGTYELEIKTIDPDGRVAFYPTGVKPVRVTVQPSFSHKESTDGV